uniref:Rap-GAP domain-containing protein n=1 Tax=Plectus sambesii TaxID=2011161 RepID=A0A914V1C5_9BILA
MAAEQWRRLFEPNGDLAAVGANPTNPARNKYASQRDDRCSSAALFERFSFRRFVWAPPAAAVTTTTTATTTTTRRASERRGASTLTSGTNRASSAGVDTSLVAMDGSSTEHGPADAAAAAPLPLLPPPRSTSTLGLDLEEIWQEDAVATPAGLSPSSSVPLPLLPPLPPLPIAAAAVASVPLVIPIGPLPERQSSPSPPPTLPSAVPRKRSSLTAAMRFMGFVFGEPKQQDKTTADTAATKRSKSMGTISRDKSMKTSMTAGDFPSAAAAAAAAESDTETIVGSSSNGSSKANGKKFETVEEILSRNGPYPPIVMPPGGGYWIDGVSSSFVNIDDDFLNGTNAPTNSCARYKLEMDDTSRCYRRHFLGREHHDFYAWDDNLGPLILSVRTETISSQDHFRIMLRTRQGTVHEIIPASALGDSPIASRMARLLCDEVSTDKFHPIAFPGGSEMILQYDEHVLTNTYKFGVIYQKFGQ